MLKIFKKPWTISRIKGRLKSNLHQPSKSLCIIKNVQILHFFTWYIYWKRFRNLNRRKQTQVQSVYQWNKKPVKKCQVPNLSQDPSESASLEPEVDIETPEESKSSPTSTDNVALGPKFDNDITEESNHNTKFKESESLDSKTNNEIKAQLNKYSVSCKNEGDILIEGSAMEEKSDVLKS